MRSDQQKISNEDPTFLRDIDSKPIEKLWEKKVQQRLALVPFLSFLFSFPHPTKTHQLISTKETDEVG
jgi:hypothetical protein